MQRLQERSDSHHEALAALERDIHGLRDLVQRYENHMEDTTKGRKSQRLREEIEQARVQEIQTAKPVQLQTQYLLPSTAKWCDKCHKALESLSMQVRANLSRSINSRKLQSAEHSAFLQSPDYPHTDRGVKLAHFKEVLNTMVRPMQNIYKRKMTTRDVVDKFVKQITEDHGKCAFSAILGDLFPIAGPPVRVKYFITHSWESPFEDLVVALESRFDDNDAFWFCAFCMNQHRVESELVDREVFAKALLAPHTEGEVLMLDEGLKTLKRGWVIFEIWRNLSHGRSMIILPKQFLNSSVEAVGSLSISFDQLECSYPGDLEYIKGELKKIDQALRDSPRTRNSPGTSINGRVRMAIQQAMYQETWVAMKNQARVLQRHGELDAALQSFQSAMFMSKQLVDIGNQQQMYLDEEHVLPDAGSSRDTELMIHVGCRVKVAKEIRHNQVRYTVGTPGIVKQIQDNGTARVKFLRLDTFEVDKQIRDTHLFVLNAKMHPMREQAMFHYAETVSDLAGLQIRVAEGLENAAQRQKRHEENQKQIQDAIDVLNDVQKHRTTAILASRNNGQQQSLCRADGLILKSRNILGILWASLQKHREAQAEFAKIIISFVCRQYGTGDGHAICANIPINLTSQRNEIDSRSRFVSSLLKVVAACYLDNELKNLRYLKKRGRWCDDKNENFCTLNTLSNLAVSVHRQGRSGDAEVLFQESWAGLNSLEKRDADRCSTKNNFAVAFASKASADPRVLAICRLLFQDVEEAWAERLGTEHPSYAKVTNNLKEIEQMERDVCPNH